MFPHLEASAEVKAASAAMVTRRSSYAILSELISTPEFHESSAHSQARAVHDALHYYHPSLVIGDLKKFDFLGKPMEVSIDSFNI